MNEIEITQKIAQLVNYRANMIENQIKTSIFGLSNDQAQIENDIEEIKADLKEIKDLLKQK